MGDHTKILKPGYLPCILDVAIDSTLPGPIFCHLAQDVLSEDNVVLMETGTRIIGNYQNTVQRGQSRLLAMSGYAITPEPNNVYVPLDGPMTDGLGRAGIPGEVDNHTFERFGGAVLLSLADNAFASLQNLTRKGDGNTYFNLNTGSMQSVAAEALRSTINIPPTITANPGATVQIAILYPISFNDVYELRPR
jgi:type IV secretion system protein VirB10